MCIKVFNGHKGLEQGEWKLLGGREVQFGMIKFLRWIVVMFVQQTV